MYGEIPKREIQEQLARILKSKQFKASDRLQRFLVHCTHTTLSGNAHTLKESALGRIVFDRDESFDPHKDSIVRTEAARLRRKLREYYETAGNDDSLVFHVTEGSYVPSFTRAKARRPLSRRTVAVLPFVNQSTDPGQEYFCDGITDDIIYTISKVPGLNVIGRTSVYAFKGKDAKVAGAELQAGTVVDGTVRKSGSVVKIYAEVIETATGEVRWAETYERPMNDVFIVQVEIAKAVGRTIQVSLSLRRLTRDAPNMEAYLLFLRGRSAWGLATMAGYRAAAELFEQAIALYPTYAEAHAGLADSYVRMVMWGYSRPREVLPKALQAAEVSLKLDPFLPHGNATLGLLRAWWEWKWKEAVASARKAVELSPSYPFGPNIPWVNPSQSGESGRG